MPLDFVPLLLSVLSLTLHDLGCLIEVRSCAALVQRQRARLLLRRHVFQRFHQLLAPSLLLPASVEIEVVRNHLENRAQLHDVVSVGMRAATDIREMKRLFLEHDQGTQKKERAKRQNALERNKIRLKDIVGDRSPGQDKVKKAS